MKIEKQEIINENWDNLIILDACRYDCFEKMYDDYFKGNLEKKVSPGGCTVEWLLRTFNNYFDVLYYSANPFINSQNLPLRVTVFDSMIQMFDLNWSWNPTEKFREVIDVWDEKWCEEKSTVLPSSLVESVKNSDFFGRKIIHFVQPHQPYINYNGSGQEWKNRKRVKGMSVANNEKIMDGLIQKYKPFVKFITDRVSKKIEWKVKKMFGGDLSIIQQVVINEGREKLIELYNDNLRLAMKGIVDLLTDLDGKTIITADHGEAFGENGDWGHDYETKNSMVRIVPWFEVEGVK